MNQTEIKRNTPLKRTPMKKRRSAKARIKEFSPSVKAIVMERSGGWCEICKSRPIIHFHHCKFRSQQGTGELKNCLGSCAQCHEKPHRSREWREWCVTEAKRLAGGDTDAHTTCPTA